MNQQQPPLPLKRLGFIATLVAGAIVAVIVIMDQTEKPRREPRFTQRGGVVNWWDPIPAEIQRASIQVAENSAPGDSRSVRARSNPTNISIDDYAGPESCAKCHPKQYASWSEHPHRWMNTIADVETVKGDFNDATAEYLGGLASFYEEPGGFRMKLQRDGVERVYQVTQTIGSRFYQYYVGVLLQGPEPPTDQSRAIDHVLPFGYWLDRKEWVPTVHVHWAMHHGQMVDEEDLPSEKRHDPFAPPHDDFAFTAYFQCNQCHTTMPLGDLMVRNPGVIGRHAPVALHFATSNYLQQFHPELPALTEPKVDSMGNIEPESDNLRDLLSVMQRWDARDHAVTLGISCESCHLGSREHVEGVLKRPSFFPQSPHLFVYSQDDVQEIDGGRTDMNLNWACGRCHAGGRRLLAGGMATWNSTEFTDAMRGSCYSQLRCVDCHDPHVATGSKWSSTEVQGDQKCVRCHQQFDSHQSIEAHTHHSASSAGSRCMNCHMPRLNEGLQDVVRTHMIFSPTQPKMIEANHPNACNMCHVDKPIDWTLSKLDAWYQKSFDMSKIADHYPQRDGPAAIGWVNSPDQSVRLIGVDVLGRAEARWALPHMLKSLDDPFIVNRQFARIAVEQMLSVKLSDYGYRHSMTHKERQAPLATVRRLLLGQGPSTTLGTPSIETP